MVRHGEVERDLEIKKKKLDGSLFEKHTQKWLTNTLHDKIHFDKLKKKQQNTYRYTI